MIQPPVMPIVTQPASEAIVENTKPFKKNTRMNFFKRQKQKNGDNWSRTNKNLTRELSSLVVDIVKHNIDDQDAMYFYDAEFSSAFRNYVTENLNRYRVRINTNAAYIEKQAKEGNPVSALYQKCFNEDNIHYGIFQDLYNFLCEIANASSYGTEYVVMSVQKFVEYMSSTYRNVIQLF